MRIERVAKKSPPSSPDPFSTMGVPRFDPKSLAQEAFCYIKRLILSGSLKGGDKIPEERIAHLLNISRTPIREAIRKLGQYGLVEIKPRSHAKVACISMKEAEEIARVRVELEKLALRSFVGAATGEDLAVLGEMAERHIETMKRGNIADAFEQDSAFHLELIRRSGNMITYDILERLDAKNQLMRIRPSISLKKHREYALDHLKVIRLLREGDERELMRTIESHLMHDF